MYVNNKSLGMEPTVQYYSYVTLSGKYYEFKIKKSTK